MGQHTHHTSEKAALREQLEMANRRLAELEREREVSARLATLGTMVGAVAHELNNILTPVMSYAQLAMASPDDRELAMKALRKTAHGAERAARIAGVILGFVAIDNNEPQAADIGNALEAALEALPGDASISALRVKTSIEDCLCAAIRPVALEQIFVNLLLNAINAMGEQGGEVEVTAECFTWNGGDEAVRIKVHDSGEGINPVIVSHLFTPFATRSRGGRNSSKLPVHRGSGLGLAICRQLVEASGGEIKAESDPEFGACFSITLPRGEASTGQSPLNAAA